MLQRTRRRLGQGGVVGVAGADRGLTRAAGLEQVADSLERGQGVARYHREPARLEQVGGEGRAGAELVEPAEVAQEHARPLARAGEDGIAPVAQILEALAEAVRGNGRDRRRRPSARAAIADRPACSVTVGELRDAR